MKKTATGRRTLLQQGLALLGGGVAVAAGTRWTRPAQAAEQSGGAKSLTLYARIRPLPGGAAHAGDTRLVSSGDLLDAPNGKCVGQFYTNCFCLGTPFGPHETAASNLEMQMLQLHDGTLFGMGGGTAAHDGEKAHAIIGRHREVRRRPRHLRAAGRVRHASQPRSRRVRRRARRLTDFKYEFPRRPHGSRHVLEDCDD